MDILKIVLAGLFISLYSCTSDHNRSKKVNEKPNVVLIMTDDQGWGDLGVNGNDTINTPNLDKLASESISFDRFYVSPVCAPTRSSLLTGRYHLRTGTSWVTHRMEVMRSSEVTIAEILGQAGYVTGCFGKWHNGEQYPNNAQGQGFDEFFGFAAGHWNNYFDTYLEHNGQMVRTKGYITDVLTDASIDFIKENSKNPFFCYIPYNAPHSPFQVPDEYYNKYAELGFSNKNASIYGMCENIDYNIGRLLTTLDNLGLTDNTIVLFLTDNGPNGQRYNGGMKGRKGQVDEGGVRVPLFIRYPEKYRKPGLVVKELSAHIDILPTVTELCGVSLPDTLHIDGRSLVPLLDGNSKKWQERNIYTHQVHLKVRKSPGAVRNNKYRLVFIENKDTLLYNMLDDPGQKKDIAGQNRDIVTHLLNDYNRWYLEVTQNGLVPPPIPAGYPQSPIVSLPAPEAKLSGNVRFKGRMGWANDWITNWTSTGDQIEWQINVVRDGTFDISVQYSLNKVNTGTVLRISIDGKTLMKKLTEPATAEYIPSPDRIKRGEVYERDWYTISFGALSLKKGAYTVAVKADKIPGAESIELKSLTMRHIDD